MARVKRIVLIGGVAMAALMGALVLGLQSPIRGWLYSQAMPSNYFSHFNTIEPSLYQISGPVYAFETRVREIAHPAHVARHRNHRHLQ